MYNHWNVNEFHFFKWLRLDNCPPLRSSFSFLRLHQEFQCDQPAPMTRDDLSWRDYQHACWVGEIIAKEFDFILPAWVGVRFRAHFGVATQSTLDLRTDTVSSAEKWLKYISWSLYTNLIMLIRCPPYRPLLSLPALYGARVLGD